MATDSLPVATHRSPPTAAIVVGVVLQLAMVAIGHSSPGLRSMWGPGGMLISLVVGVWAGLNVAGVGDATLWGAVAGGLGAFLGIGLAVIFGDVPLSLLVLGTLASTVAGIIGAVVTHKLRSK